MSATFSTETIRRRWAHHQLEVEDASAQPSGEPAGGLEQPFHYKLAICRAIAIDYG